MDTVSGVVSRICVAGILELSPLPYLTMHINVEVIGYVAPIFLALRKPL